MKLLILLFILKLYAQNNIFKLYFPYVIGTFSKFSWGFTLKDKKDITSTDVVQIFLNKSGHMPKKIWVYKRSDFYNNGLQDNDLKFI